MMLNIEASIKSVMHLRCMISAILEDMSYTPQEIFITLFFWIHSWVWRTKYNGVLKQINVDVG